MGMRPPRKRRSKRSVLREQKGMMLPRQAAPVRRGIAADPISIRLAASVVDCARCYAECQRIGGSFQVICENLCATVCR